MIELTNERKSKSKAASKQVQVLAVRQPPSLAAADLEATKGGSAPAPSLPNCTGGPRPHRVIKLGIDVHLDRYVVVRQLDGGAPQPPQRFSPSKFLEWAGKQTELADRVYSCYEAGPFGYSLHRKFEALCITNDVVRPRDWDEYGKKVKTDKRDAQQMVLCLDRYVSGNRDAFCVVRVVLHAPAHPHRRQLVATFLINSLLH